MDAEADNFQNLTSFPSSTDKGANLFVKVGGHRVKSLRQR